MGRDFPYGPFIMFYFCFFFSLRLLPRISHMSSEAQCCFQSIQNRTIIYYFSLLLGQFFVCLFVGWLVGWLVGCFVCLFCIYSQFDEVAYVLESPNIIESQNHKVGKDLQDHLVQLSSHYCCYHKLLNHILQLLIQMPLEHCQGR